MLRILLALLCALAAFAAADTASDSLSKLKQLIDAKDSGFSKSERALLADYLGFRARLAGTDGARVRSLLAGFDSSPSLADARASRDRVDMGVRMREENEEIAEELYDYIDDSHELFEDQLKDADAAEREALTVEWVDATVEHIRNTVIDALKREMGAEAAGKHIARAAKEWCNKFGTPAEHNTPAPVAPAAPAAPAAAAPVVTRAPSPAPAAPAAVSREDRLHSLLE